nr:unnamed protein product [Digitaria exilis]
MAGIPGAGGGGGGGDGHGARVGSSRRGTAAGGTRDASPGVRLAGSGSAGAEAAQGGGGAQGLDEMER